MTQCVSQKEVDKYLNVTNRAQLEDIVSQLIEQHPDSIDILKRIINLDLNSSSLNLPTRTSRVGSNKVNDVARLKIVPKLVQMFPQCGYLYIITNPLWPR